jgi:secreted Zn-dependent insulinase-like peptidase
LREGLPGLVVADLLGHEGPGSVKALLLARGWASAVQASAGPGCADLEELTVQVTWLLT